MPELRLLPLSEALRPDQIDLILSKLAELGVDELPEGDDSVDFDDVLSDNQLADFMDRLEAHDIACDIYLPIEFEGLIETDDQSIGSALVLAEALEELRDELDIDDEPDRDEDDELDLEMIEEQLSYAWHAFARATNACIARQIALHVIS